MPDLEQPAGSDIDKLVADLVVAIRYWTEDSDRCDMEFREDEVARSLLPAVAASWRRLADEIKNLSGGDDPVSARRNVEVCGVAAEVVLFRANELNAFQVNS